MRLAFLVGCAFVAVACGSSASSNAPGDSGADAHPGLDAAADTAIDSDAATSDATSGDASDTIDAVADVRGRSETCTLSGGLCVPIAPGSSCPGGYEPANGAATCLVGAQCCLRGDGGANECVSAGGVCVGSVGSCPKTIGHLGTAIESASCPGAGAVCCFKPASSCGGLEMFGCSDGATCTRPICQGGALVCGSGSTQTPFGTPPC